MIAEVGASADAVCSNSAHVAELVDAHGSGPCAARCGGSSPSVGTKNIKGRLMKVNRPFAFLGTASKAPVRLAGGTRKLGLARTSGVAARDRVPPWAPKT